MEEDFGFGFNSEIYDDEDEETSVSTIEDEDDFNPSLPTKDDDHIPAYDLMDDVFE